MSRVSLELHPGITGIIGPNGSGKSTMMRVLVGLLELQEGSVEVLGGVPFTEASVRSRIGFVPAAECFYESLSGLRNLETAFAARGAARSEAREQARAALELVGLTADGGRRYGTWSRGMRQRLKLGLALAADVDLVLLDEPFLGVDPPTRRYLRQHIARLGASGRTVLVSSHVLHEVESLTDRVGVLTHGRLLGFGRVEDLLEDLRDRNPHRIEAVTENPRALGAALLTLPHVIEVQVSGPARLVFVTEQPEALYRELPALVTTSEAAVRELRTLDHGLEAVFTHMTTTGTQRL